MDRLGELIGKSAAAETLRARIYRLLQHAQAGGHYPPVLIHGETGTGKGLVAKLIHRSGPRASGPFAHVNCAAIPDTLLESELFGFERGAFTDARRAKRGLFQAADGGVLFLDEIGDMTMALQAKLLTAIEERRVRALGRTESEAVDVWIVAATNTDLAAAVAAGRFRQDLYHRLAVLSLRVPPLRERIEDIALLADHFLEQARVEYGLPAKRLTPEARAALVAHPWPGNVRELSNVMERAALMSETADITADMLELHAGAPVVAPAPERAPAVEEEVTSLERSRIVAALTESGWNVSRAAARLRLTRNKLRYRIDKYGLRPGAAPAAPAPRAAASRAPATPARIAEPPATARPASRRRLTLLRADAAVGDARAAALAAPTAVKLFAEKVQSFGGRVVTTAPGTVVGVFGVEPTEDAPRRAVHAAMAVARALRREAIGTAPVQARLGVHVADVAVAGDGRVDLSSAGDALAVCDLLVGEAAPGDILVSPPAARLLERRFPLVVPARETQSNLLSGFRLVASERPGLGVAGQMTPFVGREDDLEFVRSRVAAMTRGHGHALGIVGDAGIGKSRLLRELRHALRGQNLTLLRGRCLSYGRAVPYFLVLDILRQALRVAETDEPRRVAERVRTGLARLELDPDAAGHLLHLLGVREGTERLAMLSDEAIRTGRLDVIRQMLLAGSRIRPIVCVAEDLHWIDKSSEAVLAYMVEHLAGARILLVTTYRPGYRPPWADRSYVTQIALQPLSSDESRALVQAVSRGVALPDGLVQAIVDKAEGNPFFLEEMTRVGWSGVDDAASLVIPDTIQDVVRARVDRLPEGARRFLCTAAVLGREISPALVARLSDEPAEERLAELVRLEFLQQQSRAGEPLYVFRHTLMQEVAYEMLPADERRRLHGVTAAAIADLHAGRLAEVAERLAYHYSRAEDHPRAVEYLTQVAERAARGYAHEEAVRTLGFALAHATRLPAAEHDERRLDLALRLASSLIPLGRFQEALDLLLQHQERVDRVGDGLAARYYFLVCRASSFLGAYERAADAAQRAIAEATACGDSATMGKAYSVLAMDAPMSGHAREGIEYSRRAVALLDGTTERWWLGHTQWVLGLNYSQIGEFVPALEAEGKAYAIGETMADPRLQTYASWATGIIYAAIGEAEAGIEACARALERAPDPLNHAIARGFLGYSHLEARDPARAIPLLDAAMRRLGEFRFRPFQGWFAVFLGEALRLEHQLDRAADVARQGLVISREATYRIGVGWGQQVLGRIALDRGALAEAATSLGQARDTFTEIQSRYELARTFMDLALVAHRAGDRAGATGHLTAAHRHFVALHVPRYVERVVRLAHQLGVAIPPVA